eukprot:1092107-Prymnesium_polylepis.1
MLATDRRVHVDGKSVEHGAARQPPTAYVWWTSCTPTRALRLERASLRSWLLAAKAGLGMNQLPS